MTKIKRYRSDTLAAATIRDSETGLCHLDNKYGSELEENQTYSCYGCPSFVCL